MILARDYFEPPSQRFSRWIGAAGMVVALHVGAAALALLFWPSDELRDDERPGAIMMELPALAAESPSDQQDLAEQPVVEKSAPPPSPADDAQETPPEALPATEPAPEKVAEAEAAPAANPVSELLPEVPAVDEAPLAPDPEVTLPKEAPAETNKKKSEESEEKTAKKTEKQNSKTAPKSESRQQQQAAASAKGKFDPNPIYRAKPAYPPAARASKTEGYVVVSYSVSASGAVSNVRVVSASPPGVFNGVTVAAVQQWRFKPSAQGAQGRRTTIRFKLR
jgi:protein TonB